MPRVREHLSELAARVSMIPGATKRFPADILACHLFDVRVSDVPSLSFLPALQLDARYLVRRTLFAWKQIVFNRDER